MDSAVTPGSRYFYRVRATDPGGYSGTSTGLAVITPQVQRPSAANAPAQRIGALFPGCSNDRSTRRWPGTGHGPQVFVVVASRSPGRCCGCDRSNTCENIIGDEITL